MRFKKSLMVPIALAAGLLLVAAGEIDLSIGQRFHLETGFGDEGFKGASPVFGKEVPLYKTYDSAPMVRLPAPAETGVALETAIQKRESVRSFSEKKLALADVARLLHSADGITHERYGYQMRAAPSGGALYPIDIYAVVLNVESLENGLYHYRVAEHSLELVRGGEFSEDIHHAANEQNSVGSSPLIIVMTARFDRSTVKYADRGYRYTYMEAGAICQNVYLQATAMGLGTVAVGAFNDDALNGFLQIDGRSEASLLIMPVGYPAAG
ncbi:MAG: SagB/ThcOx family dehydrogenase [Candidatus Zixiibacteriota bacterium]|nr:MAG: SagB/ThcOx family dehydrogenase [candidate division Zixibacteria bacterium]